MPPTISYWAAPFVCISVTLTLCALIAPLPSGAPVAASQAAHDIPFDFATRQPIVPVKVNGGTAVPFVVDTGASIHVIDREIAKQAKIAIGQPAMMTGGGQAAVAAEFVDGLTFEAGGLAWQQQRAAVASLGYPGKKHFAGLLGAPILMRYTVRFAFEARTVQLIEPSAYKPPAGAVQIPFELQENLPIVRATVDTGSGAIEARLMVDTGASQFVDLNRPFVDAHRLVETMTDASSRDRPAALGGSAPFLYATARRVTLGSLVFDRPRIGMSRAQAGSSARSERDGIIGNDLLRQFVVTVDYSRRTIVLERP
jgi:predicted aspartyl protease